MYSARFRHTTRHHSAEDILRLSSPSFVPVRGDKPAQKLFQMLQCRSTDAPALTAIGCMDAAQAILLAPYSDAVYISGWQTSVSAASDFLSSPDFADYPINSVPIAVQRVANSQDWHMRVQRQKRMMLSPEEWREEPIVDYER